MSFAKIVYTAARDGKLQKLKIYLERRGKDEVERLVAAETHGATPLVMACRNGHYDVAEYLVEKCGADVEQPGSVVFDGEPIEGAPPLWCAAAAGHFALVRLLVRRGANVNSTTRTNSTPLRAACFDGHYEIVKFLMHHGADIELANRHGHTCLMIACYRGHIKIAKFLLSVKADPNRKSVKGNTALHDCAESGYLDIMKVLVDYGARMDVDAYGMTPLLVAALTGHTHIVEYLIGMPNLVSRKERIDALELIGATYVDKKRDMIGALEFWKRAMNDRYYGNGPVISKPPPSPPVAAYDFAQEVSQLDELDELLADPDEMRMQSLVIRERILSSAHPDTIFYVRYRGAVYADSGKFDRCIELWNYALDMRQGLLKPLDPITENTLLGFTEMFSFLTGEDAGRYNRGDRNIPSVRREDLVRVFKKAISEVKAGKQMLDKIPPCERDSTALNRILIITLHLACLLTRDTSDDDSNQAKHSYEPIYDLVRLNATGKRGRSALHLIHSENDILVDKYPTCKFPSLPLTKALLEAGADVNSRDDDGNTALHLIALSRPWRPDLALALLDAGAHIDATNNEGRTFERLLCARHLYEAVYPVRYITLACLAARVAKQTQNYQGAAIPALIREFIQLH